MAKRQRQQGKDRQKRADAAQRNEAVIIYGLHAIEAALNNPLRTLIGLRVTANAAIRLGDAAGRRNVTPSIVSPRDLERELGPQAVHQGALLEVAPLIVPELDQVASTASKEGRILLVLDQVTDPHNVGAILRTAAAYNVAGLVMTGRHSPPLSGTLAKSASGGLEHVPIALVANLARALEEIGEIGLARIGLDGDGDMDLDLCPAVQNMHSGGVALVLGAEGKGLRRLTRTNCDWMCRLNLPGAIRSLNVSNAAAIALQIVAGPVRPS